MLSNFPLTKESKEADVARSRKFEKERKEWIKSLQIGGHLTVCLHETVGEELCDAVVESVSDDEIQIRILNSERGHHFRKDAIMKFSQAN